jgi:hypothetical protein
MTIEYTNLFHSKALKNLPKLGFLGLKYTYHLATLLSAPRSHFVSAAACRYCSIKTLFLQCCNLNLKIGVLKKRERDCVASSEREQKIAFLQNTLPEKEKSGATLPCRFTSCRIAKMSKK